MAIKNHGEDTRAAVASIAPDLHLSVLKPLHARWLMQTFAAVRVRIDLIQSGGWQKAGTLASFDSANSTKDVKSDEAAHQSFVRIDCEH